jgi:Tfp pilus assembly protein PilN
MKKAFEWLKKGDTFPNWLFLTMAILVVIFLLMFVQEEVFAETIVEQQTWETLLPSLIHTQAEMHRVFQEISTFLSELQATQADEAYAKMAALIWLVSLTGISLGISIITIFAILWGRNR